jgi:hypothetical protein
VSEVHRNEFSTYENSMNLALDAFQRGLIEHSISLLSELENGILASAQSKSSGRVSHLRFWSMLQRASIHEDVHEFDVAESELREIRASLARLSSRTRQNLSECFCIETGETMMLQASVMAAQSNLAAALRAIDELAAYFDNNDYHGDGSIFERMTSLRQFSYDLLGHDDVHRYVRRQNGTDKNEKILYGSHWEAPIKLCGIAYNDFLEEYVIRHQAYVDAGNSDSLERYESLVDLELCLERWVSEFPASMIAKYLLVRCSLWKARSEIACDKYLDFEATMDSLQLQFEALFEGSGEGVVDLLNTVRSLNPLAIQIAFHDYSDSDMALKYLPLSYGCVVTGASLLDFAADAGPLNQAYGIVASLFSDTAAGVYEKVGKPSEALEEMSRSVSIIEEVLRRDPLNDRALRLKSAYDRALLARDDEIDDEIRRLDWAIDYPF